MNSPQTPAQVVGALFRELRRAEGLTLRQLAERTGSNISTLSDFENGRKDPSLSTLTRYLDGLEMRLLFYIRSFDESPRQALERILAALPPNPPLN